MKCCCRIAARNRFSLAVQMAAVMKATSSARRKVAVASDVKIISYLDNLKKDKQDVFVLNESHLY